MLETILFSNTDMNMCRENLCLIICKKVKSGKKNEGSYLKKKI